MAVVEITNPDEAKQAALSTAVETPNWLTPEQIKESQDKSFAQNAAPPLITVVQSNAKRELLEKFEPGSVIAMPAGIEIARKNQEFDFVPLTSWSLYNGWTPRNRAAGIPPFVEVSRDPLGLAARKARSFVKEHNAEYNCSVQWRETICFAVFILNSVFKSPAVMMFGSTSFKAGSALALNVSSRQATCPHYAQIWRAVSGIKSEGQFSWYGLTCGAPADGPSVLQDAVLGMQLKAFAEDLKEKMQTDLATAHMQDIDDNEPVQQTGPDQF